MSTSGHGNLTSYVANADLLGGARVKYIGASKVDLAGAGDLDIGATIIDTGRMLYKSGTAAGILLRAPLQYAVAGEAIADGAIVARGASGKVLNAATAGAGAVYGVATQAATADLDVITVIPTSGAAPFAAKAVVMSSTNGTAGAAGPIGALAAECEHIGDDVRAIYAALVAHGILA